MVTCRRARRLVGVVEQLAGGRHLASHMDIDRATHIKLNQKLAQAIPSSTPPHRPWSEDFPVVWQKQVCTSSHFDATSMVFFFVPPSPPMCQEFDSDVVKSLLNRPSSNS